MQLIDLLAITSEHAIVNVVDYNTKKVISRYDGRNSIDPSLNGKQVEKQYVEHGELYIEILL